MYRFYIIFIFLYVTLSDVKSQDFSYADSLFYVHNYRLAAVEYERCYYNAQTKEKANVALQQKALCYGYLGEYHKQADVLERMTADCKDYSALCLAYYLDNNFAKAQETVINYTFVADTLPLDMLLVHILTLNELEKYSQAHKTARIYAERILQTQGKDITQLIDSLYAHVPKFKNEKTARILSFVPGLAAVYAGEYAKGITALTLNAAVLGFGIWQITEQCYLTAYLFGAGLLSATYPGAIKNGNFLVRKANYKKKRSFNDSFKEILIKNL